MNDDDIIYMYDRCTHDDILEMVYKSPLYVTDTTVWGDMIGS